jgi:23S rRNA pseudouridine1911/1915/1917 synthase
MANTEIKGEVTKELEGRIDLMVRSLLDLPRSKLTALFEHGCVTLNKTLCENPATRVGEGDRIVVTYDPNQGYSGKKRPWSDRTFSIIHEDDQMLIINKAAGVLTVPTNKEEPNTLLERISSYLSRKKKNHEAYLIHRLDRGMSGVMVFGKTPIAARHLRTQFDNDQAKRVVVAIVNGVMEEDAGTFDSHLDTHNNLSRYSTSEQGKGQHAVTNFKVTKRMVDATVVELELVTARRHQARVQLFESGHHVLGDTRYRKGRYGHERWEKKRLAMHGTLLTFVHPETSEKVSYTSELPISMKKFIRGGKNTG